MEYYAPNTFLLTAPSPSGSVVVTENSEATAHAVQRRGRHRRCGHNVGLQLLPQDRRLHSDAGSEHDGCAVHSWRNGGLHPVHGRPAGQTIYATGQGANPEYILNYLLTQNGLDPAADVTIQWLTAQEVTANMLSAEDGVCMLPVPAATALLMKDPGVRQALDLSAEWDAVSSIPSAHGLHRSRREFAGGAS